MLPKWYDRIEEPLKELVHTLRNNGFNTICSCGHYPKPYIQVEWYSDEQITELWNLLTEKCYINWTIDAYWSHLGWDRVITISFYNHEWNDREGLATLNDILKLELIKNGEPIIV